MSIQETGDDSILAPQQDEIRVFINRSGSVSIMQVDPISEDHSKVIVLNEHVIAPLIERLRELKREIKSKSKKGAA